MHKLLKYDITEKIDYAKVNSNIHHPDDLEMVSKWLTDSIASGREQVTPQEYRLICKDGEIIYVHTEVQIEFKDGKPIKLFGICHNITERKKAELELHKTTYNLQERLKELNCMYCISKLIEKDNSDIESIIQGTVDIIPSSWQFPEITSVQIKLNDRLYKSEDFKKTQWMQSQKMVVHGEKVGSVDVSYLEEKPEADEGPFLKGERDLINGIAETLGHTIERKQMNEKLLKSEENLSITLNSIGDAVIATDRNSVITRMNTVAEILTGWKFEEAKHSLLSDVFHIVNAHSRQIVANPVEDVIREGKIVGLANHTILIAKDGVERQIADSGAPIKNQDGVIIGAVLVFRDVTEQYKLEEQARQSQKMESIGTLAGGIAHDFNNMLGVITGNVSLALSYLDRDSELNEILSDVQEGAKQAQTLTQQLLTFAKGGTPIKEVVRINKLVKESATFSIRGASAKCRFELAEDLWFAKVDKGQINQVIGNLVINANQAMPKGGKITIKTENVEIEPERILSQLSNVHL